MSGHYIVKCKDCGAVIGQCRCFDRNKEVKFAICVDCQRKRDEGDHDE